MREKWIPKVIPTEADVASTVGSHVFRFVDLEVELGEIPFTSKEEPEDLVA